MQQHQPLIHSIIDQFTPEALGELQLWLGQNPPTIPISQVIGFSQFQAQSNIVITDENTASNTFIDLTTVGPQLTGLRKGGYIFIFGALCIPNDATANMSAVMCLSVNNAAPDEAGDLIVNMEKLGVDPGRSGTMAVTQTLTSDSNSVKVQYRVLEAVNVRFYRRWLVALKYS